MDDVLCCIQTKHSRKLLYDGLTVTAAKQIGVNIAAMIDYAHGDITKSQVNRIVKEVGV
jgi:hypothetical protein